jgi:hypothetical protein
VTLTPTGGRGPLGRTPPTRGKGEHQGRLPRERGIDIRINNNVFHGSSVSDLYEKVLRYLHENNYIDKLKPSIPFATSGKRYLISHEPYHPNGNRFVVPVEYKGYFMEAHKSYQNAVKALSDLLRLCGIEIGH